MVMTDPISDLLTRVRNACMAKIQVINVPKSKIKLDIIKILKEEGYIKDYKVTKDKFSEIKIKLKFDDKNLSIIKGIKRVSKPSCRIYHSYKDIPRVLNGLGIAIVSTSKGIMTDKESRRHSVGGEVLCYVW
jgi:small subunit ribosomal protein S8